MEDTQVITEEILDTTEEEVSVIEETIVETQTNNEELSELSKDIQKTKKPRSQKQIDALKKAQETRKRNLALKKQKEAEMKKAIKENEESGAKTPEPVSIMKRPYKKKQPKVVYEDDYSSDEEVIVVKKKKKKKKPKKVIYEEPSSSSEEDEPKKPTRQLQKVKQQPQFVEDEYSSDDDYDGSEYSYPVSRPLKYSDVFRFV